MIVLRDNAGVSEFVGRTEPLARLRAAYGGAVGGPALPRRPGLVLVTGEAGIGKTALLTRFAADAADRGAVVAWGTCWDGDQAPAWWPWTQVLRTLLDGRDDLLGAARPELASIVPDLAPTGFGPAASPADGRLRAFDAVGRLLARAATRTPVVVILDDLHWSDESSVDLLRFLAYQAQPGALLLVGAYRPHEPGAAVAAALAKLTTTAALVPLRGLSPDEVADLVAAVRGAPDDARARQVHERSGGHPFYARELCHLPVAGGDRDRDVPAAVRDVIGGQLAKLSTGCRALLEAAAVVGGPPPPDVLADVCAEDGDPPPRIAEWTAEAAAAGVLVPAAALGRARFAHDLYRETIYAALPAARRLTLHRRVAEALVRRHERGSPVFAAELARHFAAAVPSAGAEPALTWARAAAAADTDRFAFADAAGHLARARSAVANAGRGLPEADLIDLLGTEADLRLRAGDAATARGLLDTAWARVAPAGATPLVASVALGLDRLGARYAMPRADLVGVLETARAALHGTGTTAEAQVTAALARQLQHSVPADRPRARPLAEHAVALARDLDDPATLAGCLLAQHDALWTAGTATRRATIAAEMAGLALRAGDPERHAQALLLLASAQLEGGSAAFRVTLAEFQYATRRLRQPRHEYLLRTREAALAMLDGDIEAGTRLSAEAAVLGEAVGDTDTGNVRMSQRIEIVRARADPAELRELAAEAVRWWIGAPAHAHAIAAGFLARAGDLDAARRELDTVLALDDWRTDLSYLWSVYVGELAVAAIAVGDRPLCERLLDDLTPLAGACAVNGAAVCFMGSHAQRVGLLHAGLGRPEPARQWLVMALDTHRRLGAALWEAESHAALAALGGTGAGRHAARAAELRAAAGLTAPVTNDATPTGAGGVVLRRTGDMWLVGYRGRTAHVRDVKGMRDLATLLARPGVDIPALGMIAGEEATDGVDIGDGVDGVDVVAAAGGAGGDPVLDRAALVAYRRRLAELDDELAGSRAVADLARRERATDERERLLAELRRATRPGGGARPLGHTAAERARKAVTARVRDAIRRITDVLPDLGRHLDRTVRTGGLCRYDPGQPD